MKIQTKTLLLLFVAIAMATGVYFYERRSSTLPSQEQTTEGKAIFSLKEDQIQTLTIKNRQQTLQFERAPKSSGSIWTIKAPKAGPADDAAVGFLLSQLTTGKSDRTLEVPGNRRQEFGLDNPEATIEIGLAGQKSHKLLLGKPTFDQSSLYALADPTDGDSLNVLVVPMDFRNAIDRPLVEWQKPAQKPTEPKPQPSP
uniref:DUF4340 domain-containing protein n=1 Tax=Cyanothece sp. (strain PCC 7425 / ATCC 29141) TaxID=395961 RepID=B8HWR2_CYAP4